VRNNQSDYSTDTTLTSANGGQYVAITGAATGPTTFTLPLSNAAGPFQLPIVIHNDSSYDLTVVAPNGNATNLPTIIPSGATIAVINDGVSFWTFLWASYPNGNSTLTYNVASATTSTEAVNLGQLQYSASSNVTASRAANTVYTNTNSKYLFVYVHGGSVVDSTAVLYATINGGVTMPFASYSSGSGSTYPSGMFVVPPGATYEVTTNGGGIVSWFEMY
jgi:hypothetical protein